ncbi:MAG: VWA domain-containing protein [Epulopiscium sp.]|nr:VWA domain-containing protein [Candidatus Epulonipiscium sp.]
MVDETILIQEAQEYFDEFIKKETRSLATFTGDSNLNYIPDVNIKGFLLRPSKSTLYIPLAEFLNRNSDSNQILWYIYKELALYPDWKSETKRYLNRGQDWQKEIDYMTSYILTRIRDEKLENDPAYQVKLISRYVRKEILDLLYRIDKYTSYLRVLELCPIYRDRENLEKTSQYPLSSPKHRILADSFIRSEVNDSYDVEIKDFSNKKIFNKPFYDFIRYELIKQINKGEGIVKRDPFIRTFIYPIFESLWKEEIDNMDFHKSEGQKEDKARGENSVFDDIEDDDSKEDFEFNQEDIEVILNEFMDEKEEADLNIKNVIERNRDLNSYGVSKADKELFIYYSNKMKKEREEMKKFWIKLVGNAKQEINVKKDCQVKGKLDIDNLINFYPDFVEAEQKGNYQNLPIFNRYILEPKANILPERIEISFIIDNSGSMNELKIESARKALAVTLLSLDDFNRYLNNSRSELNRKIEVLSETWFFGSSYYKIKEFNPKEGKVKEESDIIRSIVKLDAKDGVTDEAACLKEILEGISPRQEKELKTGKQVKLIFLITDGASSFPGASKKVIEDLILKNVDIYGFQIGKSNEADQKVFNFIWNDGYRENRGLLIGEEIESLPKELLKTIKRNMGKIFASD